MAKQQTPPSNKACTSRYDLRELKRVWAEVRAMKPAPEHDSHVLARPGGSKPIKRWRFALQDDAIGLGMQLRWSVALEALRDKTLGGDSDEDAADVAAYRCGLAPDFLRLGSLPGAAREAEARAWTMYRQATNQASVVELCAILNKVFGDRYRSVASLHKMTPELFRTPYHGSAAVAEFDHLLRTGEESRFSRANRLLLTETKRYVPTEKRTVFERQVLDRLCCPNDGRPIQCITAPGAQTAVEALALHLAESLPAKLHRRRTRRRDIILVPCGRWVHPSATRGLEYLVHNLVEILRTGRPSKSVTDLAEVQLLQEIDWLRELLGQRPVILIFVGHDAFTGKLVRLQEAAADAPLTTLLTHLSRPRAASGGVYEAEHFEWTFFLVIGNAEVRGLGEYSLPTLPLPALAVEQYPDILSAANFQYKEEIDAGMRGRDEAPSEAAICMYEQIRRIEAAAHDAGEAPGRRRTFRVLTRFNGHRALSEQLFHVLDVPQRQTQLALLLLTAFATGGIKRATLLRSLMLWRGVFPERPLPRWYATPHEWFTCIGAWIDGFLTIIRAGPDEEWKEISPMSHPFEYADGIRLDPGSDPEAWWSESVDFLIGDVRNALVEFVEREHRQLAEGIHRILAEEALRQHTMALRHTAPADRLTMRTHRRGLQALYHGLASLPADLSPGAAESRADPASHLSMRLPRNELERFRYLYCALAPSLLRYPALPNGAARWGAESVALEVALFADKLVFQRLGFELGSEATGASPEDAVPAVGVAHLRALASAAARLGPHADWQALRQRLAGYAERYPACDGPAAMARLAELHMNLLEYGPDDECTGLPIAQYACCLGIDLQEFEPATGAAPATHYPQLARGFITRLADMPPARRSLVCSTLIVYGMMRSDLAEARLERANADRASAAIAAEELLGCFAALVVARDLIWQGHGRGNAPPPFLAAEGLQTLCTVGLEIVRLNRRAWPDRNVRQDEGAAAASLVTDAVIAWVRRSLDEYVEIFHRIEVERTQALVLEARYARIAGGCPTLIAFESGIPGRVAVDEPGPLAGRQRRAALALQFLHEADRTMVTIGAPDSLALRLLSEFCSALRLDIAVQLDELAKRPLPPRRAALQERARVAYALACLCVRQMEHVIARFGAGMAKPPGRKGKWLGTVQHQAAALAALKQYM